MFSIKTLVSERRAANLLAQVRWHDGVYCSRCRAESVIQYGSYRVFQRYRCKNCDRTFNDKTGTVFEHSSIALRKWFLAVYAYIRFNTSLRQRDVEIEVSYKTVYRRVQRFLRALDVLGHSWKARLNLTNCTSKPDSKAASATVRRARVDCPRAAVENMTEDKLPVFVLVDRGTNDCYVLPAKSAKESTVRLLLADHEQESLTVYTDGLRAYDPLEDDEEFDREYVVHGDGEYADGAVHVNTCESQASLARRLALAASRRL
ncbi:IS1595 family transposase [Natrinema soli]|uniref:IS1595 family transposase n=1 Tax=Natrinema soli TaxID=1930624 RepID=A0ABD5SP37_9EURY|nr:IS1595 family transposase [Natrinema soli]